jgi:hypothetical protein
MRFHIQSNLQTEFYPSFIIIIIKCNGKILAITFLESVKGMLKYGSTLSLTSALDVGGCLTPHIGRYTLWHV